MPNSAVSLLPQFGGMMVPVVFYTAMSLARSHWAAVLNSGSKLAAAGVADHDGEQTNFSNRISAADFNPLLPGCAVKIDDDWLTDFSLSRAME